jgi:hypothetical protein
LAGPTLSRDVIVDRYLVVGEVVAHGNERWWHTVMRGGGTR